MSLSRSCGGLVPIIAPFKACYYRPGAAHCRESNATRPIIRHYPLFKNAGPTIKNAGPTIEEMLDHSFPDGSSGSKQWMPTAIGTDRD